MFIINDLAPSKTVTFSEDIYYHPPDPAAGGVPPKVDLWYTTYHIQYAIPRYFVYHIPNDEGYDLSIHSLEHITPAYLYIDAGLYLYIGLALFKPGCKPLKPLNY